VAPDELDPEEDDDEDDEEDDDEDELDPVEDEVDVDVEAGVVDGLAELSLDFDSPDFDSLLELAAAAFFLLSPSALLSVR
jgi:hypothetical protein